MATRHRCLAVCSPGLESLLVAELKALGITTRPAVRGGVPFGASTRQLYVANVWSRLATRVLVRLEPFTARTFADLERQAWELPWESWIAPGSAARVRVTSRASRLYHTTAIAERVARLARCHLVKPADDNGAPTEQARGGDQAEQAALIVVRIERNRVEISVDTSGDPLHRRGWRPDGAKAPLRETLAAAALAAVGWDGTVPLVDPFCGSGTIPIEAATIAIDRAPGLDRSFAVEQSPGFEPGTWSSVQAEAHQRAAVGGERTSPPIVASDRDAGAAATTEVNAARAGVADRVEISRAVVSDMANPGPSTDGRSAGWIVTNPPWGARVSGGGDLRDLYAQIGNVARDRFAGWSVAMWVADTRTAGHSGLKIEPVLKTNAGGRPITLLAGPIR